MSGPMGSALGICREYVMDMLELEDNMCGICGKYMSGMYVEGYGPARGMREEYVLSRGEHEEKN